MLILTLVSAASACRSSATGPEQRYDLKGKVVNIDKRGATVTIAHDAIAGYMDAMTMPFKLKDERLLNDMADGDRVQATLVVAGAKSWLEDVVVTRETVDQSSLGDAQKSIGPKPGEEIPDFLLVNQDGKRISLHKYRPRAVVLTFVYTRCPLPDYCPLMTDNFSEIAKSIKSEPELNAKTRLLSISVDPEYDTPKVLREYAAAHSADPAQWEFATGSKEQVNLVATYFGLQYWPEGDQIIHSLRTAIIAPDGKLVKIYRGNEWKPADIVADLRNIGAPEEARSKPDIRQAVGVIQSIDRELAQVQIDHEDIKDFMPAMNMPFPVKDRSLLDQVSPGDKVDFWFEASSAGMVVIRFQKR